MRRRTLLSVLILGVVVGCGPSLSLVRARFSDPGEVAEALRRVQAAHPELVHLETLGSSWEGRPILAARLGREAPTDAGRPALLAIFSEHGNEHDVTNIALGVLENLSSRYDADERVRRLLDRRDLWLVPIVNPDGVAWDLSGQGKPMTWRKNRRPTAGGQRGVDLNRNWGRAWEAEVPEELAEQLADPASDVYAGERPFSENETRALRDFVLAHPELRLFVDYHSGSAPFLQGGVGFPIPPDGFADPCEEARMAGLAEGLASAITDASDGRPPFVAVTERDVAPTIRSHAPWYLKPLIPRSIPAAPGSSGEWVFGVRGIPVLGVEVMRDFGYLDEPERRTEERLAAHVRGFLFLLEAVPEASCPRGSRMQP